MKREWQILHENSSNDDVKSILLLNRGLSSTIDQKEFLNPPSISEYIKRLPKELKKQLKIAKSILLTAMDNGKKIVIYGDYDADGVCATAVLYNTLKTEFSYDKVYFFVPNRFEHGYGLSKKAIDEIFNDYKLGDGDVFITVDTGITAADEISYIKEKGCLVVLTDHHQKPEDLPQVDSLVWWDAVVGTTLSWLVSKVIGSKNKQSIAFAAIATVTDVQPVFNINRRIVIDGLKILNSNPPDSIMHLMNSSGIRDKKISTYELGWVIGPKLNASGRMQDAEHSINLLISEESSEITAELALKLTNLNNIRQESTNNMYELVQEFGEFEDQKLIISHDSGFHEGLIGLVASRLVRKFNKPSIVISQEGEISKGSVRSVPGINIIDFLRQHSDLFENLGGHPMAAGFSIKTNNIDKLKEVLLKSANNQFSDEDLVHKIKIDMPLKIKELDTTLLLSMSSLEPYGVKNPEPVFVTYGLKVVTADFVGRDLNHLKFRFLDPSTKRFVNGIYFNTPKDEIKHTLLVGTTVDVVYKIKENVYNGNQYLDLQIVDLRVAEHD